MVVFERVDDLWGEDVAFGGEQEGTSKYAASYFLVELEVSLIL